MAFSGDEFSEVARSVASYVDPRFLLVDGDYQNVTHRLALGVTTVLSFAVLLLLLMVLLRVLFSDTTLLRRVDGRPELTGNGYVTSDFLSRRLDTGYDAINVLYMLEEAFRKLEVDDYECQQRIVCEAHEANAPTKYGRIAGRIQKIIGSADDAAADEADEEVAAAFRTFRDAAVRGIQQEDCQLVYSAKCPKGLRDIISSGTKY